MKLFLIPNFLNAVSLATLAFLFSPPLITTLLAEEQQGSGPQKAVPTVDLNNKKTSDDFDQDGDGKLNKKERKNYNAYNNAFRLEMQLRMYDKNNNRVLDEDERWQLRLDRKVKNLRAFDDWDVDEDGKINPEERQIIIEYHYNRMDRTRNTTNEKQRENFTKRHDKDKDGFVDDEELTAGATANADKAIKNYEKVFLEVKNAKRPPPSNNPPDQSKQKTK